MRFEPRPNPALEARRRRWQASLQAALAEDEKKRPG